ncbi:hypothetical protein [Streptomyces mangrovisoli]|uniref:Uncharacterized protein n=1 Tax=Streptomyces mangrovisoli TaxID=1428628 RepID=A0A1J4NSH0_9ACTN|nr:hypothetical protein [Streptomyces mangrovisoli]OIJ65283.1 hypothetical protein WN71_023640 [Streptomyces mangrovisoli]
MTALGDLAGVDERTVLVLGQDLRIEDGHTFAVRGEAVAYLDGLPEQAAALQTAALGLIGDGGRVSPNAFTARCARTLTDPGVTGANPNAIFTAMTALNQLHELGLRPESPTADAPWSRPATT